MPSDSVRVIRTIMRNRFHKTFILPNYTPADWWECDVFEITKAGFFREYEVKVSRADFIKDREKTKTDWSTWRGGPYIPGRPIPKKNKHDLLGNCCTLGPRQFWFVTLGDIVQLHEVPSWAGLIVVAEDPKWKGRLYEREAKPAPRLHATKIPDTVVKHSLSICYWRMHELHKRLKDQEV
jgi:hypothetical protein